MFKTLASLAFLIATIAPTLSLAQETRVRLYAFGNSLVNHLSEDPDTNVPTWLARMARADGRLFSMDGQWGFLRDFARTLPPVPNWSFKGVRGAWNPGRTEFGDAGFNRLMITPANFIQHRPAEAPFEDLGAGGTSPLDTTLEIIDWVEDASPGTRITLYEGWAEMSGFTRRFPPSAREFKKYLAFNQDEYHRWYQDWENALQAARPGADIRLIPVASTLSRVLRETALADIDPDDLYVDADPHGQATLYLLAAMITYTGLFDAPPPAGYHPPENIHPLLRENFAEIATFIWEVVTGPNGDNATLTPATPVVPSFAGEPPPIQANVTFPDPELRESLDTGLSDPALAMGLNGLSDWSVQHPFIDLFKTARTWNGHTENQWGAWNSEALEAGGFLDTEGWPRALPGGVTSLEALILTDQPMAATRLAGRYRVTFEGEGRLQIAGRARDISERDGEIWFSYTPGDGSVALSIQETDPAGTGDHIRNISVVHAMNIPLHEAGVLFNPDWLAVIKDLRSVRFMDWMQTNNSPVESWADRPVAGDYSYTRRGVPLEVMVRLANEIGADPWFCMPHMADDDFSRRFAEYVHAHLDPRLVAYVEYSNETWNFIFEQTLWARDRATERWGRQAESDGWMQFSGMRAREVMDIWHEVYADDARARLKRVIAVHTGWPGLEETLLTTPLWRAENPGRPDASEAFDAYAVSGYFGYDLGTDEMAANVRDWMALPAAEGHSAAAQALRQGSLAELLDVLYPHHAEVASDLGFELIMYEGGTHVAGLGAQIGDEEMTSFFNDFNYSQEMAELYGTLLAGWRDAGGTLFNAFVDVARPSQWGSWGGLRHLEDDNPRWQALTAYNHAGSGWETRDNAAFLHGVTLLGGVGADILSGTGEEDVLIGGGGDDVLVTNGAGDYVHGGDGLDVAILPGTPGEFQFEQTGDLTLARRGQVVTSIFAVELLQFSGAPAELLDLAELP